MRGCPTGSSRDLSQSTVPPSICFPFIKLDAPALSTHKIAFAPGTFLCRSSLLVGDQDSYFTARPIFFLGNTYILSVLAQLSCTRPPAPLLSRSSFLLSFMSFISRSPKTKSELPLNSRPWQGAQTFPGSTFPESRSSNFPGERVALCCRDRPSGTG